MPFRLGTASISEISIYSLWKYYIKTPLKIKENILLDIELLTLPFNKFLENCLVHSDDYTPYLEF